MMRLLIYLDRKIIGNENCFYNFINRKQKND